jgi:hypothetical protein
VRTLPRDDVSVNERTTTCVLGVLSGIGDCNLVFVPNYERSWSSRRLGVRAGVGVATSTSRCIGVCVDDSAVA